MDLIGQLDVFISASFSLLPRKKEADNNRLSLIGYKSILLRTVPKYQYWMNIGIVTLNFMCWAIIKLGVPGIPE